VALSGRLDVLASHSIFLIFLAQLPLGCLQFNKSRRATCEYGTRKWRFKAPSQVREVRRHLSNAWQWNSIRKKCINCISEPCFSILPFPLGLLTTKAEGQGGKGEINKNAKRKLPTKMAATMAEAPPPFSCPLFICFAFRRASSAGGRKSMRWRGRGLRFGSRGEPTIQ